MPVTATEADESFAAGWEGLRLVLEDAPQKLTVHDILCEWPEDCDKPSRTALWKWLQRALATGSIAVEGAGRKSDPYRYWLPAREAHWRATNPLDDLDEQDRKFWKSPFQSLHGKRVDDRIQLPFPE